MISLILMGMSGCGGNKQGPAAPPAPPPPLVKVATAEIKSVDSSRHLVAELKAPEAADIRSRVEGYLMSHNFREGSPVVAGQVLFQLDPRPYEASLAAARAQVAQAEGRLQQSNATLVQRQASEERARQQVTVLQVDAELEEARANLRATEREVERFKPLVENGAVPPQRYDEVVDRHKVALSRYESVQARLRNTKVGERADVRESGANVEAAQADVRAAQASLQAARAQLQAARLNLNYTTIRAPFSGVIGTLGVDVGSLIIPGQTRLATLSKNDPIYADFPVDEAAYLKLASGPGFDQAPFELVLANEQPYPHKGRFVLVDRSINQQTGTITVRAAFPNPGHLLKPGGFGRVKMQTDTLQNAVVIPQKALTNFQSLDAVYVLKDDMTVEQRMVKVGEKLDGEVVVLEGVNAGERVVTEGLQKIRPGATVSLEDQVS